MPTDKKVSGSHDPCYLGRTHGVYDARAKLVQLSTSAAPIEMAQALERFLLRWRMADEAHR